MIRHESMACFARHDTTQHDFRTLPMNMLKSTFNNHDEPPTIRTHEASSWNDEAPTLKIRSICNLYEMTWFDARL
jgi:hypothetical protein